MIEFIGDYIMLMTGFIQGYNIMPYIWNSIGEYSLHCQMFFVLLGTSLFICMGVAGFIKEER